MGTCCRHWHCHRAHHGALIGRLVKDQLAHFGAVEQQLDFLEAMGCFGSNGNNQVAATSQGAVVGRIDNDRFG